MTLHQSSTLDPGRQPDGRPQGRRPRWGRGVTRKGLKNKQRGGDGRKLLQGLRNPGDGGWVDRCTRNSTKEVSCSAVSRRGGGGPRRQLNGAGTVLEMSLEAGSESAHRTPVMEHNSGLPVGGGGEGVGVTDWGWREEQLSRWPAQGRRGERAGQAGAPSSLGGEAASQRGPADARVVEGTEVLVSTVPLWRSVGRRGGQICL